MNADIYKIIETLITVAIGGGAVAIGRFVLNLIREKNSLDIQKGSAALDRAQRQQTIDRTNSDYIITHFEKTMADKDRDHERDAEQWNKDKLNILTELRRTRDAHQINLATMEGMRIRLADRERLISELRGGVHPLMATPDRTDSVIITDGDGVIYYINQNVTLITKWADVDIIEKNITIFFPDKLFPAGKSARDWLNPDGGRDRLIKARLRQKDGVLIPVDMLVSLFSVKSVWVARFQMRQTFEPENVNLTLDIYVPPSLSSSQIGKAITDETAQDPDANPGTGLAERDDPRAEGG